MIAAAIINDALKVALPVALGHDRNAVTRAVQTPYLTYDASAGVGQPFTPEEAQAAHVVDMDGIFRTPFPTFRFCMSSPSGDHAFGYLERSLSMLRFVIFHRWNDGASAKFCASAQYAGSTEAGLAMNTRVFSFPDIKDFSNILDADTDEQKAKELEEKNARSQRLACASSLIDEIALKSKAHVATRADTAAAKQAMADIMREVETLKNQKRHLERRIELLTDIQRSSMPNDAVATGVPSLTTFNPSNACPIYLQMLTGMCYHYLAPFNFVARVQPENSRGKSTEWLRAREHYTLIHRHHAANNAAVQTGTKIDDARNCQRLAHSRRAHTKLLTHAKWTFKRGQRVFVRASWVGPKEWKDTAGQTYQILIPAA